MCPRLKCLCNHLLAISFAYAACWFGARNCEMVPTNLKEQPHSHSGAKICAQCSWWWSCWSSGIILSVVKTLPFCFLFVTVGAPLLKQIMFFFNWWWDVPNYVIDDVYVLVRSNVCALCRRSLAGMRHWSFTVLKRPKKGRMRTWNDDVLISQNSHGNLDLYFDDFIIW